MKKISFQIGSENVVFEPWESGGGFYVRYGYHSTVALTNAELLLLFEALKRFEKLMVLG